MIGFIEIFSIAAFLLVIPIALACFGFWVWMLVDAVQKEDESNKIAWVLIIVFLHFLGALIYFFVRKIRRPKIP